MVLSTYFQPPDAFGELCTVLILVVANRLLKALLADTDSVVMYYHYYLVTKLFFDLVTKLFFDFVTKLFFDLVTKLFFDLVTKLFFDLVTKLFFDLVT